MGGRGAGDKAKGGLGRVAREGLDHCLHILRAVTWRKDRLAL